MTSPYNPHSSGNSNLLRPTSVPPETLAEMNQKLKEATARILGTTGVSNQVVLVRDMQIPELTIAEQAMIDAITPHIGADGQWYIGSQATGVMAGNYVTSPDGSVWSLNSISNDGTRPVYVKVFDPTNP